MFEQCGAKVQSHAAAVNLSAQTSMVSAKLAAALSDDDIDELGMTIAYLKRALRGVTSGLDSAVQLQREGMIDGECFGSLNRQLFEVRDGIITLMGSSARSGAGGSSATRRGAEHTEHGLRARSLLPSAPRRFFLSSLFFPFPVNGSAEASSKMNVLRRLDTPAAEDELKLVARCQAGDTAAFNELVTRYRQRAFAMIYHMVRNEQDAWDLTQDGFLKAWKSIARFRGQSSFLHLALPHPDECDDRLDAPTADRGRDRV